MHRRNRSDTSNLRTNNFDDRSEAKMSSEELNEKSREPKSDTLNAILDYKFGPQITKELKIKKFDTSFDDERDRKTQKRNQRISYKEKKKQANIEVRQIFLNQDTTIISGWLRLRNSIKNWVKLFCVAKPGLLILFRSSRVAKAHNWAGTIMLNSCQMLERPSKKDGFCFKLFHPLGLNFWAKKGPRGQNVSNFKSIGLPLSYLIIRTEDVLSGKAWVDGLNCARLTENFTFNRSTSIGSDSSVANTPLELPHGFSFPTNHNPQSLTLNFDVTSGRFHSGVNRLASSTKEESCSAESKSTLRGVAEESSATSSSEVESTDSNLAQKQTNFIQLTAGPNFNPPVTPEVTSSDFSTESDNKNAKPQEPQDNENLKSSATKYVGDKTLRFNQKNIRAVADLNVKNSPAQNNFSDTSCSDIQNFEPVTWFQRFGQNFDNLFILEELVSKTETFERIKLVVRFGLSILTNSANWTKIPLGPVLGETYRCAWQHGSSKTFLVAECVSINPTVVSAYLKNHKIGYVIKSSIALSTKLSEKLLKFASNGQISINLIDRNENYNMKLPYSVCEQTKDNQLSVRLVGNLKATCERTGYSAVIKILPVKKIVPDTGEKKSAEITQNSLAGMIKLGKNEIFEVRGDLDESVLCVNSRGEEDILWSANHTANFSEFTKFIPEESSMIELESNKIWKQVLDLMMSQDLKSAESVKKDIEMDRNSKSKLKSPSKSGVVYQPRLFRRIPTNNARHLYRYKFADERPWDGTNDLEQIELNGGEIRTLTKLKVKRVQQSDHDSRFESQDSSDETVPIGSTSSGLNSTESVNSFRNPKNEALQKVSQVEMEATEAIKILEQCMTTLKTELKTMHQMVVDQRQDFNSSNARLFLFIFVIAFFSSIFVSILLPR